jgi:hypothetical protein
MILDLMVKQVLIWKKIIDQFSSSSYQISLSAASYILKQDVITNLEKQALIFSSRTRGIGVFLFHWGRQTPMEFQT